MGFGYGNGVDQGREQSERLTRLYGSKPKKTVFDTAQCAHVWAQQNQEWGRNAKGTVFFEGDTIYSYGHHFPMARIIQKGKRKIALFNRRTYSPSTSSHQGDVRGAISHLKIFEVADVGARSDADHAKNLAAYKESFEDSFDTAKSTRHKPYSRRYALGHAMSLASEANEYARTFLRKRSDVITVSADVFDALSKEIEIADATKDQKRALLDYRRAKSVRNKIYAARAVIKTTLAARRNGAEFEAIDARQILRIWRAAKKAYAFIGPSPGPYGNVRSYAEHATVTAQGNLYSANEDPRLYPPHDYRPRCYSALETFISGYKTTAERERIASERAAWERQWLAEQAERQRIKTASLGEQMAHWRKTGEDVTRGELRNADCMLRLLSDRDEVQTSWGASFPAEHARRAWPAIKRIFNSGLDWKTNGHRIPMGHFQVDAIISHPINGATLKAGCHSIKQAEIEALARDLGLLSAA